METFGARLRGLREAAGLTQEQLAERAGLSANAIGALERGERRRPYPHTLQALADALGLPEEERTALAETVAITDRTTSDLDPAASLPAPLTRLVGREQEVTALAERLTGSEARLITLTGPGGVGKTRLALQVAADLAAVLSHGVAFVSLAPLADPTLVLPTIAGAVDVREMAGRDLRDALRVSLRRRQMLLVLDNFEHDLPAAVEVAQLLAACPQLRVLVTSRVPLHLRGEQEIPVEPLGLPDLARVPSVEEVADAAAVQLFVERAREVSPAFDLTPLNAAAVAAICRRLDGLPLAIELAAAWIKVLPPVELLARLDRVLPLLAGRARDLPGRQRTMERTIAWSYDLLDPPAQTLFRRLAVFAGGFSLGAAEAIASEPTLTTEERLGLLGLLVEQSLVASEHSEEARYHLLEPVRQYARQLLEASGDVEAIQHAHAAWYLKLAEQAEATLGHVGADARWLDRLEAEHDNLRGALLWLLRGGDAAIALQLAAALWPFWHYHSHLSEGRRWLREALAAAPQAPASIRARALLGAAFLAHYQGDDCQANDLVNEGLTLARELGDTRETLSLLALLARGILAEDQGHYTEAVPPLEEAQAMARKSGDRT
ncbi:MAG: helix-turn-helix domain-containing protein [Chloroflexota bacterium]|nr:helix-turn-helix domain-containing protein [Chloroflexota bacterium]